MQLQHYITVVLFFVTAGKSAAEPASICDLTKCDISTNCRCSSASSPIAADLNNYPHLISLTFDEAVTEDVYTNYWEKLLISSNRKNPDGGFISGTFFVPHEYTDYKRVNDLYNFGFEIGVHSISKNPLQEYWRTASEETLIKEFQGQKSIIAKFANIPEDDIMGVRTPQFQLSGNNSIKAYIASKLSYDSSWPSLPSAKLFPYTLDYSSTQQCILGAKCPNEAFPGFWILPINDLAGDGGAECNTLASCDIKGTAEEIAKWLGDQIEKISNTTRTPINLIVNSYWFESTKNSFDGLNLFLDNVLKKGYVFIVQQKQVLEFIKDPKTIDQFKTDDAPVASCQQYSCKLEKGKEVRNMECCVGCPAVYPWLGNPDGNKN